MPEEDNEAGELDKAEEVLLATAIGRDLADETRLGVRYSRSDFEIERTSPIT